MPNAKGWRAAAKRCAESFCIASLQHRNSVRRLAFCTKRFPQILHQHFRSAINAAFC